MKFKLVGLYLAVGSPSTNRIVGSFCSHRGISRLFSSGPPESGIRINKCLPTLSRRASDYAVWNGTVTINDVVARVNNRVFPGDIVKLNNVVQDWESRLSRFTAPVNSEQDSSIYLKYWKPLGVTCTSDIRDPDNIIQSGDFDKLPQRVNSVGRLDKDTTGIILLTSSGPLQNKMLRPNFIVKKIYTVEVNKVPTSAQLEELSEGVAITTWHDPRASYAYLDDDGEIVHRGPAIEPIINSGDENKWKEGKVPYTAKTLPCEVTVVNERTVKGKKVVSLEIALTQGRNRQIRKMMENVGLRIYSLHRTSFAGITLSGLNVPGDWCELTHEEKELLSKF